MRVRREQGNQTGMNRIQKEFEIQDFKFEIYSLTAHLFSLAC